MYNSDDVRLTLQIVRSRLEAEHPVAKYFETLHAALFVSECLVSIDWSAVEQAANPEYIRGLPADVRSMMDATERDEMSLIHLMKDFRDLLHEWEGDEPFKHTDADHVEAAAEALSKPVGKERMN